MPHTPTTTKLLLVSSRTDALEVSELEQRGKLEFRNRVALTDNDRALSEFADSTFDQIHLSGLLTHHSHIFLTDVARCLTAGGTVVVREPVSATETSVGGVAVRSKDDLVMGLILAGLMDASDASSEIGLSTDTPRDVCARLLEIDDVAAVPATVELASVCANKPEWEAGTGADLKTRAEKKAEPVSMSVWQLDGEDEEANDIYDDTDFLADDDLVASLKPAVDDCEYDEASGVRKACDNCSCGRAEMLDTSDPAERVKLQETLDSHKSGCGNCGMGDAFRCGSCPYMGLPSFKPGQRVVLSLDDDSVSVL